MAVISKRVCDRCGEEIAGRERRIARLSRTIRLKYIIYEEYKNNYKTKHELCRRCTSELTLFLNGEGVERKIEVNRDKGYSCKECGNISIVDYKCCNLCGNDEWEKVGEDESTL